MGTYNCQNWWLEQGDQSKAQAIETVRPLGDSIQPTVTGFGLVFLLNFQGEEIHILGCKHIQRLMRNQLTVAHLFLIGLRVPLLSFLPTLGSWGRTGISSSYNPSLEMISTACHKPIMWEKTRHRGGTTTPPGKKKTQQYSLKRGEGRWWLTGLYL